MSTLLTTCARLGDSVMPHMAWCRNLFLVSTGVVLSCCGQGLAEGLLLWRRTPLRHSHAHLASPGVCTCVLF